MLILLTAPAMLGNQSLAAGVMADVPDDVAQRLIAAGVAQAIGSLSATDNQQLHGAADAEPAPPAALRRRKTEG